MNKSPVLIEPNSGGESQTNKVKWIAVNASFLKTPPGKHVDRTELVDRNKGDTPLTTH